MSYMIAVPDMLSSAAGDLASIGSSINASTRAAAAATTRLLPAAADEVSAHIAALFSGHGEGYQAIARQMAAFHDQFTLAIVCRKLERWLYTTPLGLPVVPLV